MLGFIHLLFFLGATIPLAGDGGNKWSNLPETGDAAGGGRVRAMRHLAAFRGC